MAAALVVDDAGVFGVGSGVAAADRMLQLCHRVGRPHVLFALGTPGVFTARTQVFLHERVAAEGRAVRADGFLGHLENADAAHLTRGAVEVLLHEVGLQAHRLEQLRAAVAQVGAHAHLGHDFAQALADGLDIVVDGLFGGDFGEVGHPRNRRVEVGDRFECEVGVNRLGPVPGERGEVVDFAGVTRFDDQPGPHPQALFHQVVMDAGEGEQRGNGDPAPVHPLVGEDDDVVAALNGVHRPGADGGELGLDAACAPLGGIGDVEVERLELAARVRRDVADAGHVVEVEDRLLDFEAHGGVDRVDVEQVGARPDEGAQAHDHRLADGVDGRVGHLGEQLPEIVVQRLGAVREDSERGVVAHAADAFLAGFRHRPHQELEVFLGVAERLLTPQQRLGKLVHRAGFLGIVEAQAGVFDPLAVGLGLRELHLEFVVLDDAALFEVDHEHPAGLQAPLFDDLRLGNGQHARLGGEDHQSVAGLEVAGGAQAVAVEHRAHLPPVGKHHRGGAVPGFHHRGVVLVERPAAVVEQGVLLPRFGNHHHRGLRHRVAREGEQFQRVVEGGGVRLALVGDGVELAQVVSEDGAAQNPLACPHPVEVALDGVDFAVVGHHAVGVGEAPLGEGVGGKALVNDGERRHHFGLLQVAVVLAHLIGEQQTLIDDGPARHGGHVVLLPVREVQPQNRVARAAANHVQLALQRVGHQGVGAGADENLADDRLFFLHRRAHRHGVVDGHVAPAEHHLPLGNHGALEFLLAGAARGDFLGQENHAHAVVAGRRQGHALKTHLGAVEGVGDLQQDARAVAHEGIGTDGPTVVEVFQNLEALGDDVVRLLPADVGHHAHPTGVVFGIRVQAALGRPAHLLGRGRLLRPGLRPRCRGFPLVVFLHVCTPCAGSHSPASSQAAKL